MDMHTHLVGDITSADIAAPLQSSAAEDVLQGVANARATLRAGFTTVRDVGAIAPSPMSHFAMRSMEASIEGPRMFVAGAYITVTGGGGEVTGFAADVVVPAEMRRGVANSANEVRQRVRELIAGGATFIKVIATGAVLTAGTKPGASEYTEAEIRAAVEEAAQYGVFVTAHAHGAEGIKRAVRAGVRSIEHASYLDDEGIALMKKHGTWLVADIYNGDYIDEIGRRDRWTEEIMRKNRETTQTQRDGFCESSEGRRAHRLWHRQRRLSARRQRAAIRLHGSLWLELDGCNPIGDAEQRAVAGPRDAISARSPSASSQT